jgi:uncharacterized membrane protein YqjE
MEMKLLLVLMSGLEISDGVYTDFAVGKNMVEEGNSLMESLVLSGDFILFKVLGALLCSLCLWLLYKRFRRVALTVTTGVIVFYSAVMVWNLGIVCTG